MNRLKILMLALITFIALNAQGQMYRNYPKVITMAGDSNLVLLSRYDASTQTWASKRIHWEDLMEVIKDTMNTLRLFAFDDSLDVHSDTLISHDSRINAAVVINTTQGDTLTVHKTKLNTLLDSISAHWVYVANHDDSLGVHNTRLNALIDSLSVHWTRVGLHGDTLDAHNDRLKILEGSGSGAKVSVSDSTLHSSGSYATRSALTDTAFWHWYYISNQEDTLSAHLTKLITVINLTSSHSDTLTSHDDRINKRVIIADSTLHASGSYASRSALTDTASAHWTRSTLHGDTIGVHNTRINARVQISDSTGHSANNYASRSALTDTASAHHTRLQTIEGASGLGIKVNVSDSSGHSANNYATRSALTDTASAHHTRINAKVFASDSTGHSANNYASRSALTDTASLHWAKSGILCDSISAHNIRLNTATNTNLAQTDSLTTHGTKINARVQTVDSTAHSANNYASRSALTDTSSAHWTKITLNTDSIASHNARLLTFEGGDLAANKVNKSDSTAHSADHYASRSALTDTASLHWTRSTLHGDTLTVHNNRLLSLEGGDLAANKVNKVDSTDHSANHYASRSALTDTSSLHWTRSTLHGDTLTNHNTRINARVIVSDSTGHSANNYASRSALTDTASAIRSEHATTDGLKLNKADSTSHLANHFSSRSALTDTASLHWTRITLHGDTLAQHIIKINSATNINTTQGDTLSSHNSRIMASVQDVDSTGHTANSYATRSALTDTALAHHGRLQTVEGASGLLSKVNKSDSTGHSADHYASRSALTDTASTHWTRTTLHGDTLTSHNNRLLAFEGGDLAANKVNKADSTAHSADNYATRSALTDTALLHWTRSTLHGDTLDAHNGRLITLESGDLASNKVNKVDSTAHSANNYASRSALTDTASLHWTRATLLGDTLTSHNTRINLRVIVSDSTGHSANNYASRSALTDTASTIRSQLASTDALKVNVLDSTGHSANNYSSRSALTDTASLHWLRATLHGDTLTAHNIKLNTATNTNASQSDTLTAHNTRINNRVYIADSSNHSANHYASRSALTDTATAHHTRINLKVNKADSAGHSADNYATRSALTDSTTALRDSIGVHRTRLTLIKDSTDAHTGQLTAARDSIALRVHNLDSTLHAANNYASRSALTDTASALRDSVGVHRTRLTLLKDSITAIGPRALNDGHSHTSTTLPATTSYLGTTIDSTETGTGVIVGKGVSGYLARFTGLETLDSCGVYWDSLNKRLSIGTTAPEEKLTVQGTTATSEDAILRLQMASGHISPNNLVGGIEFYGQDLSTGGTGLAATIGAYASSEWNGGYLTKRNTYLSFSTTYDMTLSERVRIDNTGNIGNGTTTPYFHDSMIDAGGYASTGWHYSNSTYNLNRTSGPTASDTASIGIRLPSGNPVIALADAVGNLDSLSYAANVLSITADVKFSDVTDTAGVLVTDADGDLLSIRRPATAGWLYNPGSYSDSYVFSTPTAANVGAVATSAFDDSLNNAHTVTSTWNFSNGLIASHATGSCLSLYSNTSSEGAASVQYFTLKTNAGNDTNYATISGYILDNEAGQVNGTLQFDRMRNGLNVTGMKLDSVLQITSGVRLKVGVIPYTMIGQDSILASSIAKSNAPTWMKNDTILALLATDTLRLDSMLTRTVGGDSIKASRIKKSDAPSWMISGGLSADSVFQGGNYTTTNYVPMFTSNRRIGDSPIVVSGTAVGIGWSPSYPLDVNNAGAILSRIYGTSSTGVGLRLDNTGRASGKLWDITVGNASNGVFEIIDEDTTRLEIGTDFTIYPKTGVVKVDSLTWSVLNVDSLNLGVGAKSTAPDWMKGGDILAVLKPDSNTAGEAHYVTPKNLADSLSALGGRKMDSALSKDLVAGFGLTGGADNTLPGSDSDVTVSTDSTKMATLFALNDSIATIRALETWIADPTPNSDHLGSGRSVPLLVHETVGFGDACYINSDGEMAIGDADAIATGEVIFFAGATITTGNTGTFYQYGTFLRDDSWDWTKGGTIYLSTTGTTGNTMTQIKPTGSNDVVIGLGKATATNIIYTINLSTVTVE